MACGRRPGASSSRLTSMRGLEGPAGRVGTGPPGGCGHRRLDQLGQLAGGGDGAAAAGPARGRCGPRSAPRRTRAGCGRGRPRVGGDHLGRGDPGGGVHPHVQGGVGPVAEAAVALVQLEGGDPEVVEDPVDGVHAETGGHLAQVLLEGRHRHQAVPGPGEALAGQGQRGRVAVQADDPAVGGAGLQQALGVAAEAEGGVDEGRAGAGPEQVGHPVDHDRLVTGGGQHHQIPSSARWAALVSSA